MDTKLDWNWNNSFRNHLSLYLSSGFGANDKVLRLNEKVVSLITIFSWSILYLIHKNWFNSYLRQQRYAMLKRNRISNVSWNFGFISIITLYTAFLWDVVSHSGIDTIIVRSFYIHHAGVSFLMSRVWVQSFTNLLHVILVFGISRPSVSSRVTTAFLLKNVEMMMLEFCKLVHLKSSRRKKLSNYTYIAYCIFWAYLHLVFLPDVILSWNHYSIYETFLLYSWIVFQYLDFPWLDFIKCFKSSKYLESRLFPNPPLESVQLKKIWDHRNSSRNRNINESLMANKKLSETLFCAIALKKKLYRLRKSKQEKLAKQVPEEEASNED